MFTFEEFLEETGMLAAIAAATPDPLNEERRELANKLAFSFKICGWAIRVPAEQISPAEKQAIKNWWRKVLVNAFPSKAEHFKSCSESELRTAAYEAHAELSLVTIGAGTIAQRAKVAAFSHAVFVAALVFSYPARKTPLQLVASR